MVCSNRIRIFLAIVRQHCIQVRDRIFSIYVENNEISQCFFDLWIRDRGWQKNPDPGFGICNPESYLQELNNNYLG
jgi:hypothetical protein